MGKLFKTILLVNSIISGLVARDFYSSQIGQIEFFTVTKTNKCQGWQVEEINGGVVAHHYHNDGTMQVIQVTNSTVYFLVPGPYGFDGYPLTAQLPKKFPYSYKNKCCWLRKTKNGQNLMMTYKQPESLEQLLLIETV